LRAQHVNGMCEMIDCSVAVLAALHRMLNDAGERMNCAFYGSERILNCVFEDITALGPT
jgi:hypothetical protein